MSWGVMSCHPPNPTLPYQIMGEYLTEAGGGGGVMSCQPSNPTLPYQIMGESTVTPPPNPTLPHQGGGGGHVMSTL